MWLLRVVLAGMVWLSAGAGEAQTQANAPAEPAVRIVKLNFASVTETVGLLNAIKSADGKVAANEEARTVVLMDSPERIKAMVSLISQVDVQTVTAEIQLKFSRAGEVLDKVRSLLTQSVGVITADAAANKILVTDTPSVVEKVKRAVEQLDPRGRKILLEAKLVHVALDDEHVNGVDWSGIVEDHQNIHLSGRYSFLGNKDSGELLSLGTIEGSDFVPLIEALDTVGVVKEYPVRDIPVMSDSDVFLEIRFDQPGVFLEAIDPDARDIQSSEGAAVSFVLKPQIDVDGTLKTGILVRETKGVAGQSGGKAALLTRNARAVQVRSADGGSIVLGGFIATGQVLVARKVPLVGDIPLLGLAFRYHNSSVRREEFALLLTLKIAVPEPAAHDSVGGKKD